MDYRESEEGVVNPHMQGGKKSRTISLRKGTMKNIGWKWGHKKTCLERKKGGSHLKKRTFHLEETARV